MEREFRFRQRISRCPIELLPSVSRDVVKYASGFRVVFEDGSSSSVDYKRCLRKRKTILCEGTVFKYACSKEVPYARWSRSLHKKFLVACLGGSEPLSAVREKRWTVMAPEPGIRCDVVLCNSAWYIDYEAEVPSEPRSRDIEWIRKTFEFQEERPVYRVSRPYRPKLSSEKSSSSSSGGRCLLKSRKLDGVFGNLTVVSSEKAVCVSEDLKVRWLQGDYPADLVGVCLQCEVVVGRAVIVLDLANESCEERDASFYTKHLPELCERLGLDVQEYFTGPAPTVSDWEDYVERDGSLMEYDGVAWRKRKRYNTVELRCVKETCLLKSANGHTFRAASSSSQTFKIYECLLWFDLHPLLAMVLTWLEGADLCSVLRQREDRFFPNHVTFQPVKFD